MHDDAAHDPADSAPDPPRTPRDPVTEELHGRELSDPYRWLEGDDDRVEAWTERQNAHTEAVLSGDRRERLRDRFANLSRTADYGTPTPAGDRLFQLVRESDAEQPSLVVRDASAAEGEEVDGAAGVPEEPGEARVLADPETWSDDSPVSIDWYVPGPDGELVAFGVAPGGTEQYDVHVLDAETGEAVDEVPDVGRGGGRGFAWTDDGFYYTRTGAANLADDDGGTASEGDGATGDGGATGDDEAGADGQLDKEIRFHELGADPETDRLVADEVRETVWPVLEADDGVLVVEFSSGWDRSDVFALDADPTDPAADLDLVPVLTEYDAVFSVTLDEGICYLRTDYEAPNSRVLAAPVDYLVDAAGEAAEGREADGREGDDRKTDARETDALDPDELVEALPERDAVLRDVVADGDYLVAHYHRDAHSLLEVYEGTGPEVIRGVEVGLDPFSTVSGVAVNDGVTYFSEQSFDRPATVRAANLATGVVRTLQSPDAGFEFDDGAGVEVTQEWFESADGTEVPAFVVRREGVTPDGDNPAVLTGYGGFRVNRTPTFDRYLEPFLEAGGVFVLATLRGGTEYGEAWHAAGRREHKQNVFDDFLAVSEGLIDQGWAGEDRLAITGGSNGGLLVGAALTQRPDLFAAVLCRVPLLDMLRFHRFLLGASWTSEYGSPEDPEAFEYLREYSPYHNVEATAYPATLLTTATGDSRVHPGHARKMAARLQERTTGDDPILLRVRGDTGHGVGKPRSMVVDEQAENWAFICRFLDVPVGT